MYKHHLIELRPFSNPLCSTTVMLVTYVDDRRDPTSVGDPSIGDIR